MDWPLAIDRNRKALSPIIAALFALVSAAMGGLNGGGRALILPRRVHAAIMLVLRPAESAVRRLIVIAARGLVLTPRTSRPLPSNLPAFPSADSSRIPAFALLDSLKHFDLEDFDNEANPHVSFSSSYDPTFFVPSMSQPHEPVNAALLFSRLRALRRALDTIPHQARRLVRWQQRRDAALKAAKPTRMSPMRPGLPPGWRERSLHEVDEILRECHGLASYLLNAPDTG